MIQRPFEIAFQEAVLPAEVEKLLEFDRRVFGRFPDDLFTADDWLSCHSFWMVVDGARIGCSAFEYDSDIHGPRPGCIYIVSTGILPEYQGQGLGKKQKKWQIQYARKKGFRWAVTNMRESNRKIIGLNEELGFVFRETVPNYYTGPDEAAIVMELSLAAPN